MGYNLFQPVPYNPRSPQSPDLYEDAPPVCKDQLHALLQRFVDNPRLLELGRDRSRYRFFDDGSYIKPSISSIPYSSTRYSPLTTTPPPPPAKPIKLRLVCKRAPSPPKKAQRLRLTAPRKPEGIAKKKGGGKKAAMVKKGQQQSSEWEQLIREIKSYDRMIRAIRERKSLICTHN